MTIYKAYIRPKFEGISLENECPYIVQYLHFRILKLPLVFCRLWGAIHRGENWLFLWTWCVATEDEPGDSWSLVWTIPGYLVETCTSMYSANNNGDITHYTRLLGWYCELYPHYCWVPVHEEALSDIVGLKHSPEKCTYHVYPPCHFHY